MNIGLASTFSTYHEYLKESDNALTSVLIFPSQCLVLTLISYLYEKIYLSWK